VSIGATRGRRLARPHPWMSRPALKSACFVYDSRLGELRLYTLPGLEASGDPGRAQLGAHRRERR
jgi:hypothetical protein